MCISIIFLILILVQINENQLQGEKEQNTFVLLCMYTIQVLYLDYNML
jgi:hypothetical protein